MMHDNMMDTDFANDFNESMDSKSAGRWTMEEHTLFLEGLQLYNKQWKFIADLVKTRTVVQIRTHAQKYFQKLEKGKSTGVKKDSLGMDSSMPEFKNASSRTSSISSADSFTTSEGESDSERGMSIGSMEDSSHLMITLPNPKSRSNSKSKIDSPKKRSRDGKPTENKSKGGKKSVGGSAVDFPIPQDMGVNGDVLFDFMQLDNYESEDLDHSIINLLEKIDWNVPGSRPHSPFMDSANLVTVSMDSWDGPSESNSQMSDFHAVPTDFLGDLGMDTVPSSQHNSSFSNVVAHMHPASLATHFTHASEVNTSSSLKDISKPSAISENINASFMLPLVSPITISAPNLYSPNNLCTVPTSQKEGDFGSFPFDQDESEVGAISEFDQPRKRGRSIDPIISATNFALPENKSGIASTNEIIGDKFEDLLDSGILLDSF